MPGPNAGELRLFVAVDDNGVVQVGGPWALMQVKGSINRSAGSAAPTASLIVPANTARRALLICNLSTDTIIWLGEDDAVTSDDGFPLFPQNTFMDDVADSAWYGVVATGAANWRALEA